MPPGIFFSIDVILHFMKRLTSVITVVILLSSCEKNITLKLNSVDNVLVVDGSIENGKAPVIVLTKSIGFFSSISPKILDSSFVHNAVVTISNGTLTQQLKEYTYDLGNGFHLYQYSIDSSNLASTFTGEINTTYTLNINSEGKNYTSVTTIPAYGETLDSLWWNPLPFDKDSTQIVLLGKFTDPPGLGNYSRYFTKVNSEGFLPGRNSVFDDEVVDGTTYQFHVDPGIDRNNKPPADSNYFKKGDTITVKLCSIDKATFTFWNTWEFAYQSIGNPFAQPNQVIGNINNGALGAFCGYAAVYKSIIIPK